MFFPRLKRRQASEYHNNRGKFYSDYRRNYDKILEDCQHRCVYCDIELHEMGGEGMHLDHFRPQKHFPRLANDPFNLVSSCPKCNALKSDDWPCVASENFVSFEGEVGYLDPFSMDPADYLLVKPDGSIVTKNHPTEYLIKRLQLNRKSRTLVRRTRIVSKKEAELEQEINNFLDEIHTQLSNETISHLHAIELLGELKEMLQLKADFSLSN